MAELQYVIVRKVPDPIMTDAAHAHSLAAHEPMPPDFPAINTKIYTAMLSASPPPVSLEEIVEVLRSLRFSARLLHQNAVACVEYHHGLTPSDTGWLADCLKNIERADAALARAQGETP